MHRPGIARVYGDRIILDGTTMEEIERYHAKTLKLALEKTNEEAAAEEERQRLLAEQKRKSELELRNSVGEISKRLNEPGRLEVFGVTRQFSLLRPQQILGSAGRRLGSSSPVGAWEPTRGLWTSRV
jgi:hypothetical protein